MTNEEITKGLEICSHPYNNRYTCGDCPYYDTKNCIGVLLSDARNRIIEQKQEIEQLKAEFKQLETNAEILARGVRDLHDENYELTEQVKQAKTDVLNELRTYCVERENYKGIEQQQKEDLLRRNEERKFRPALTSDEIFAIKAGADKANGQSTMANKVVEKIDRMIEELKK